MPPDTPCPSAELLRRSLEPDDPMPAAERQRIEAHVGRCSRGCKQAIDVLLRGNTELIGPATAGPGPAPAAAECPARLGRYRIVGQLGSGGFGTVYRGYDDELRRDVAVKAPHRSRIATPADAEAYLAEARTVAGLDHPHIVPVFDLGRSDDGLCFGVSKFIEGGDLSRRIQAARPSFAASAALTATVAEALHHAHKRGLVHRDVKPANILIDAAGAPFLTDFGLALQEEDYGKGGGLAGTPAYMSPEQANGEGRRVDGRSDIFSLGVVLYELLTGRRPFRADSMAEVLGQITGVEARPPRQTDDAIPKELERICLKALAKRASERYTTAKDMADDLRHFLAGTAPAGYTEFAERIGGLPVPSAALPNSAPAPASDGRPLKVVPKGLRSFDAHDADFFLELLPGPRDRDGLTAFGQAFGKLPEKAGAMGAEQQEFLNQAASALSQDNKVVCVRLALFADMMKGRPWTPAALKEVGGAEGVGATFLEETFAAAAAPPAHRRHQKAARAVLQALLPESGSDIKGHMRSRAELLAASGYGGRPGDFDDLIRILDGEIRLITPTDPQGADEGAEVAAFARTRATSDVAPHPHSGECGYTRFYQLTHDYLVPSPRDWLTRKQKETRRGRAELLRRRIAR